MRRGAALLCVGYAATVLAASAWAATAWQTVVAFSTLEFTGSLAGGDFKGQFGKFDAGIVFDPADLAGSRFRVVVDTGSADTSDADRDTALKGADFFASDRWPTATYEASEFVTTGPGQFEARGRLTMRGVTRDLPVTFSFRGPADGRSAALTGEATIHRLDFGIGQGEWQDTKWLGNDVRVRFAIVLKK
jgi:polyisoprenoid-binding protein YceI